MFVVQNRRLEIGTPHPSVTYCLTSCITDVTVMRCVVICRFRHAEVSHERALYSTLCGMNSDGDRFQANVRQRKEEGLMAINVITQ